MTFASTFPYIALEGCDGAGKSTIRLKLAEYIRAQGFPVVEVGQHSWLDIIAARVIIDARENRASFSSEIIADSYRKDKLLHMTENIRKNGREGLVISDRSFISDIVYQEALYGMAAEETLDAYLQLDIIKPNILLYVSVDVTVAVERIERRAKHRRHYERETDLKRVLEIYQRILRTRRNDIAVDIIEFKNDSADIDRALHNEVYPAIDRAISTRLLNNSTVRV